MSRLALVAVLLAACVAVAAARPVLDDALIAEVNAKGSSWKAGRNARFEGVELEDAVRMLGSRQRLSHLPTKVHEVKAGAIPDSFDARQQWPNCIHPIRDQQQCGSCWAFGASEVLSDRFCISENVNAVLSPQDLVSCDKTDSGCNGGYLDNAWNYMKKTGIVSDKCFPYTSGDGNAPACPHSKCPGSGSWAKYKAKSVYDLSQDVSQIQTEIMTNGPVEAAFDVYQDFFSYTSGVYTHQSGSLAGGHAIKIVGWGVTTDGKNTPYWIVANSWGTSWGQNGFFWILRGQDECGIESNIVAGLAGDAPSSESAVMVERALDANAPILDDEMINKVNTMPKASWKASHNKRFHGMKVHEARRMLGALKRDVPAKKPIVLHAQDIPTAFDSRTQWPKCIHPIRDQQQCGSCWAFAATESLSDRLCIASNGAINVVLSPQELVSCDTTDYGCQGGYLDHAWQFMASNGVPADSCYPYTSGSGDSGTCSKTCTDGSAQKMYYAQAASIQTLTDAKSIQTAIMTNGPVEAAFTVYQDFFSYTTGVYSHTYGSAVGGHAVKIVGWGEDNGTPYWIVANSWGTSWGQNGFFWIKRGTDECGIEDGVVVGLAKTN